MDDIKDWLLLLRLPAITCIQLQRLLNVFGSPAGILRAQAKELRHAGLGQEMIHHLQDSECQSIEKDITWLNHPEHYFIPFTDDRYPVRLKEIPEPPPVLFVKGNPETLSSIQLGIVGSRNPSHTGKQNARMFAGKMAQLGITVTSGLASGIDYFSHAGALDHNGRTIAVLGNGPDLIYPRHHAGLAERIASDGAVISEFVPGTPPLAMNFPRRNRIISGLSVGILVVEAAHKSGSLITAKHALEQGREVFAVPGSIHNPLARGCHSLIKQGAKLVESYEDILEELNINIRCVEKPACKSEPDRRLYLDTDHKLLLQYITDDPVSIDELVSYTGLTVAAVSSMLLTLEIQGVIAEAAGGCYTKRMMPI